MVYVIYINGTNRNAEYSYDSINDLLERKEYEGDTERKTENLEVVILNEQTKEDVLEFWNVYHGTREDAYLKLLDGEPNTFTNRDRIMDYLKSAKSGEMVTFSYVHENANRETMPYEAKLVLRRILRGLRGRIVADLYGIDVADVKTL